MTRQLLPSLCAILFSLTGVLAATIPCLSGFVRDDSGSVVVGVDLDFIDVVTGEKLITPGDNTDALGFYNVCVLPGVYDVTYAPPPGTRLMGKLIPAVDLTANVGVELDVVLIPGTVVSGMVTAIVTGGPLAGVDIDVDRVDGGRIFTPDDNTDATGAYSVVIPNGLFRFRFEPPLGARLRGVQLDSVAVAGDLTLDVALPRGVLLEGRVTDDIGLAVAGTDIELRDWGTGEKLFVANNTTDLAGDYVVAVPTGTFQLRYQPPRGEPLVAVAVDSFVVSADAKRDQILAKGNVIHLVVRTRAAQPVEFADIDVKVPDGGQKLFTPYDKTDADGTADAVVPEGTYQLTISPPIGSRLDGVTLRNVPVSRDTTIMVTLPEAIRVLVSGRVVDENGTGVAEVELGARSTADGNDITITDSMTDATGFFTSRIPKGTYDIRFTPPRGSRFVGHEITSVSVMGDSSLGEVQLAEGRIIHAEVSSPSGLSVSAARIEFTAPGTSQPLFTPHNLTDATGTAIVAVLDGVYDIAVTPPSGSIYASALLPSVVVNGDATLEVVLTPGSGAVPGGFRLGHGFPNPFNSLTTIPYDLEHNTEAMLDIYNVAGQHVRTLRSGNHPADSYTVTWDGTDDAGQRVSAGLYFVRLETALGRQTEKLLLVR